MTGADTNTAASFARSPCRGRRRDALACALAAALVATAGSGRAETGPCGAAGGEAVTIAEVEADFTLALADGRHIFLVGVDPPRATPDHPALAVDARRRLEAWLAGRTARLRSLAAAPDRWNRVPALVDADPPPGTDRLPEPAGDTTVSVALAMVDAGLGRAKPDTGLGACWAALIRTEGSARGATLGLWADPYYAVREASDAAALADAMGHMALVQGRVTRISRGRSRVFVGLDGRDADFTLRFISRKASILADLGLRANPVKGSLVRVRGILDDRFGATIEVTSADQVEILNDSVAEPLRPVEPRP